jgi:hypothetical protein
VEEEQPDLAEKILEAMNLSGVDPFQELITQLFGQKEEINQNEIIQYSLMAAQTKNMNNCVVKPSEAQIRKMFTDSFKL